MREQDGESRVRGLNQAAHVAAHIGAGQDDRPATSARRRFGPGRHGTRDRFQNLARELRLEAQRAPAPVWWTASRTASSIIGSRVRTGTTPSWLV